MKFFNFLLFGFSRGQRGAPGSVTTDNRHHPDHLIYDFGRPGIQKSTRKLEPLQRDEILNEYVKAAVIPRHWSNEEKIRYISNQIEFEIDDYNDVR